MRRRCVEGAAGRGAGSTGGGRRARLPASTQSVSATTARSVPTRQDTQRINGGSASPGFEPQPANGDVVQVTKHEALQAEPLLLVCSHPQRLLLLERETAPPRHRQELDVLCACAVWWWKGGGWASRVPAGRVVRYSHRLRRWACEGWRARDRGRARALRVRLGEGRCGGGVEVVWRRGAPRA